MDSLVEQDSIEVKIRKSVQSAVCLTGQFCQKSLNRTILFFRVGLTEELKNFGRLINWVWKKRDIFIAAYKVQIYYYTQKHLYPMDPSWGPSCGYFNGELQSNKL